MEKKTDCKIKLDILHGFGSLCSQGLRDSVSIIDDESRRILFPIGRYFALKSYDKPDEQFIKLPDNTEKLICMAVSPNRKCLAASVKIKGDEFPNILIYNLKSYLLKGEREKLFRYTDTKSPTFSQIAFSGGDARFLVCMTSPPSSQIIFLDIARMKQLGMATLGHSITTLRINPKENHVISLSGNNVFKILRVQENQFKQLNEISQLPMTQCFTDHDWLDESYLIIGTDKGTVYIVQSYEVQEIFENAFNVNNVGIVALTAFNKGFIIGSDKGHLALYMKIDEYNDGVEDFKFMLKKTFMADRKSHICHINISQKNDLAAISFKSNDIATFELSSLLSQSNETLVSKEKDVQFEYLFNGFHSGAVTSLDVCLQRPLLVTCSKYDSSIRVWNYMNFKCELARKFFVGEENSDQEVNYNPLICVAFHPFGYYIAAGFVDKIRYFHLLHDQLRIYKEIVLKNCCLLRFSNGGQYLAAAYNKNKSTQYFVNIYNSYSAELLGTLKGHSNIISDLQWNKNDQYLYTIGQDGNVFTYDSSKQWSRQDFQSNDSKFTSMVFGENGRKVVAGEQHGKYIVREIEDKEFQGQESQKSQPEEEETKKVKTHQLGNCQLTTITYLESLKNYQAIIGGCDQGFIRVYSSIFNQKAFEVMASHDGEVSRIRASPDGRYVFSGGQDGTVFIYQVSEITADGNLVGLQQTNANKDVLEDNALNPRAMIVDEHLADVVLVARAEIDKYLNKQKQLRNEIEDLENKIEQKHLDEKLKLLKDKKEAEEQFNKQLNDYNMRYEELKAKKSEVEKDYSSLLKNMENNHLKAVEELENLYEKKLGHENEKYIQLETQQTSAKLQQTQLVEELKVENRNTLDTLKVKFQDKFLEVQELYKTTKENAQDLGQTFMEKLGQQENEYEGEIEGIRENQKKDVESLMMENMQLKSRYDVLGEDNRQVKEKLESVEKVNDSLENLIHKQQQTISDQDDKIKQVYKEVKDQQETLRAKEKKLYEYKFKISDLQKAKHVLTFRTAEMRKSLEPKEAQIEKLKEELFKIEGEFESMLQTSQKQNEQIKKLVNQVETVESNLEAQKGQTRVKESHINRMAMDIYNCVNLKDTKDWPHEMKQLYQKYVQEEEVKQVKEDPKGIEERQRQISHLENCIDQIHVSSNNIIKRREVDIRKKTMENAILIYDLNQIRKQNKEYQSTITTKTTECELKNNEIKKLKKDYSKLEKHSLGISENNGRTLQMPQTSNMQQLAGTTMDNELSLPLLKQHDNSLRYNGNQQSSVLTVGRGQQNIGGYMQQDTQKKMTHLLNQQNNRKQVSQGKLYRGTNFDSKTLGAFDKAKIVDLMTDLENGSNKIFTQENELARLRHKIQNHVIEKGCTDLTLEDQDDNTRYFQQP